jgi:hypothetical protein
LFDHPQAGSLYAARLLEALAQSSFFDGRFMVEIEEWNWALSVGLSSSLTPRKYRFQGGLAYTKGIDLSGRIRAPSLHRGAPTRVWISTIGRNERFDASKDDVGRFYVDRLGDGAWPFEASLRLPEDALSPALTCLGSSWKFIDIWTATNAPETAVTMFCFSATIHPNLAEWAGPALDPL